MTAPEVAKLVAVLMAALPGAHVGPQTSAVYERMLADLDFETARVAVEQVLATWRYASMLPSVAEIRERVMVLKHGEVSAGGEAWGLVRRAIESRGRNRTPGVDFELEPVALETVRALGWVNLCSSETPVADRARFIELYDQLAARGRRDVVVRTLPATAQLRELATSVAAARSHVLEQPRADLDGHRDPQPLSVAAPAVRHDARHLGDALSQQPAHVGPARLDDLVGGERDGDAVVGDLRHGE